MKFLLDENVHRGLFSFLVGLGHDIKLSPKSIKNGEVSELCIKEERILVSRDEDFLKSSSKQFGIILLRVPCNDLEAQKRAISKLLEQSQNIKDSVVILVSDKKFEFIK